MMVVQGSQVGQTQQQLGEEGAVVRAAAGDEGAQGFYEVFLQLLHSSHVHDARAICSETKGNEGPLRRKGEQMGDM